MSHMGIANGTDQPPREHPPKTLIKRAKRLLQEGSLLLRRRGKHVPPKGKDETQESINRVSELLPSDKTQQVDPSALAESVEALERALSEHFGRWRKSTFREYVESIVWAVGLALLIRAFIFEAFSIPSSS